MLTEQAILAGVAGVSGGLGVLRVSSLTEVTIALEDNAASNRVSTIQEGAGALRTSAIQDSATNLNVSAKSDAANLFRVSAIQEGAGALMVSAKSNDAALLRMSAIGGTTGDRTMVDGVTQTVSAVIVSSQLVDLSSLAASARRAIVFTMQNEDAAEAGVSAKSQDAALLRVSALQDGAAALNVSAKSNDGALLRTSSVQEGAGALRTSAMQDSGANLNVSAKSQDGALLRTSAVQDGAGALNVSAKSDSANLLRVSSLQAAATQGTGGTSIFSTSAGIAQTSAVKSSTGRLYGWYLFNPAGVDQYLQIFDASAVTSVTLGTTVPGMTLGVPTLGGANLFGAPGIAFSNGIVIAATSTAAGNTAGASAVRVNVFYG